MTLIMSYSEIDILNCLQGEKSCIIVVPLKIDY